MKRLAEKAGFVCGRWQKERQHLRNPFHPRHHQRLPAAWQHSFFPPAVANQKPRCKQRGIKLAALQSSGVFDPRGSRQMSASSHLARCSRE